MFLFKELFFFYRINIFPDQNVYVHTFVKNIYLWKTVLMEIFQTAEFWISTAKYLPLAAFTLYQRFACGLQPLTLITWANFRVKWSFLYVM